MNRKALIAVVVFLIAFWLWAENGYTVEVIQKEVL